MPNIHNDVRTYEQTDRPTPILESFAFKININIKVDYFFIFLG